MCSSPMVLPSCPSRGSSGVKAYLWDGAHPLARRRFPALIDYRCGVACIMGGGAATAIGKHLGGMVFYWRPWFLSILSDSSESSFPIPPPASLGALGNVWKILKGRSTTIPYRVINVATDITFVGVRNGVFKCLCHRCYSPGYRCWGWSASHVVIWVIIFLSVMLFALVSQIGELATANMSLLAAFVVGTLDQWQHHRH